MSLSTALAQLKKFPAPVIRTNDAAALWSILPATASTTLARLARDEHILRLSRGIWLIDRSIHPWLIHQFLSDPSPSYISLQTALYHHGMIEQIPTTIHLVTTAKTRTALEVALTNGTSAQAATKTVAETNTLRRAVSTGQPRRVNHRAAAPHAMFPMSKER